MQTRDLVEATLFYIGAPAATLYPLGFAGLFLQLWSDQFFPYYDYATLWSAVAMIPKIEVMGTGLVLLYLSLFATLLSAGFAFLTFNILSKRHTVDEEPRNQRIRRRSLWSLFLLSLLPFTAFLAYNTVHVNDWYDVPLLTGFLVFSAGGGIWVGGVRARGEAEWFRTALIAAYVGALFAALCLATLDAPDLPLVEVNAKHDAAVPDCSELPQNSTFVKVSEAPNLMYLYNQSGFFASHVSDIKPVRYLKACKSLRTQR